MDKLKSMRVTSSFRDYVLEQLGGVRHVMPRSMFGGIGLYADGLFFAIIAADTLYFKVDNSNRPAYEAADMPAFRPFIDKPASMSYYQVPAGVLENSAELTVWAKRAIAVAAANGKAPKKQSKPKPRGKKPSTKRA